MKTNYIESLSSFFDQYKKQTEDFHGFAAPGMLIGGFMVRKAQRYFSEGVLYEALCETLKCLPDAVQLLTPCTFGNGRLKMVSFGKFALSLFDKNTGKGIRVFIDQSKLESWPEIRTWYLKLKSKKEQDSESLISEIREAGEEILLQKPVQVKPEYLGPLKLGPVSVCPLCNETYPISRGIPCPACQGENPYL